MQTAIVATDFSPAAKNATLYAVQAAKAAGAKLILFHLYQVSPHVANSLAGPRQIDDMWRKRQQDLEQQAAQLTQEYQVPITAVVRMGVFMEQLRETAAEHHADLLITGMPKKSFELDLLGSTTTSTIYRFQFPILAIPESASFKGIKKILYACDLTRGIHQIVLDTVKNYAGMFGASVEVLYVGDVVKDVAKNSQELADALKDIDYTYKNVRSESVISAIQAEAEAIQADILIMTPHRYGFWASLLHRSKTRAMASNGRIPLLSLSY